MFEVLLPAGAGQAVEAEAVPEPRKELRGAGAVLVADDEELVRKLARATLTHFGYTVLEAENGAEAVEVFREHADEISLVLLDMMMPVQGGEEALEEIRAIRPGATVIGSSGFNESVAKERFGGQGLASFLQKPYSARALAERVKQAIEDGRATGAGRVV
jgi:CheY-like chemotaxis protein